MTKDHRRGGAAKQKTVPKVRLYVERPEDENWFVHVGHVTERGRRRTEPHAHPAYGQVIFVLRGRGVGAGPLSPTPLPQGERGLSAEYAKRCSFFAQPEVHVFQRRLVDIHIQQPRA